jgi:N,N'-diacetyllegionaminate synthase
MSIDSPEFNHVGGGAARSGTQSAMHIASRHIARDASVYVIAELGVNHDGSPERLVQMVVAASEAGADAVKFQLFRADLLMSRASRLAAYQASAGESDPLAMLRRLELSARAMEPAVRRARELGLHAIATVFSADLVEEAQTLPLDAYKTASPDIINRPLLDLLAATGKPLIVSTGAATLDEVTRAVGWLKGAPGGLALLQCVSCYPTAPGDAAIGGMIPLMQIDGFHGPVGYSDHTVEVDTGAAAARLGAAILEKHFTHDKRAQGPDHAASLEPAEFRAYASLARDESQMRLWMGDKAPRGSDHRWGPPEKRVLECERDVRRVSRQSLVARAALPAGHILSDQDVTIKRPGTGIEPWRLPEVRGRRLVRAVEMDMPITPEDLA